MNRALQQGSQEWLDFRRGKIGASDAPIIMGVSPWRTPHQLWKEMTGQGCAPFENQAMKRGRALEECARMEFEKQMGVIVFPSVLIHERHDWMIASLDGIDIEETFVVEIKCPGQEDQREAMEGRIPKKYYPQLQHQMEVARVEMGYYFSYHKDGSCKVIEIKKDQTYIDQMIEKELKFWNDVKTKTSPELCDKDYHLREDDIWQQTADMWRNTKSQLMKLEAQEEELRKTLINMTGQYNCRGGGIRLTKTTRKGNVDYARILDMEEKDLEIYRKPPIETWKITQERG